ncbi:ribosome small subunit-dependent GTPase A [Alicyclobacillus sp. ALC3]|uniref:ribosome small subunit-dependent GTPase A n=1 Tax=Alicyclobacillus sp. ALC3 TaxID=2796143 RepID=UPI00237945CB|nr:ribosome small subunit-dependent GTPase A [Alicyclobacillus sp. ALC3]WDL97410.1 ribosome small subunit-dependent GTPase A [Alicyclobacillus sp. ALC3]
MQEGVVVRSLSGFFDVTTGQEVRRCRARGVFRKRGTTVLVGDRVTIELVGMTEGIIYEVLPRQTELIRPPVANVDQAVLVLSAVDPAFMPHLLDRLLVSVVVARLSPVIVITKVDLADPDLLTGITGVYTAADFAVFPVVGKVGQGVETVRTRLRGHVSVFVGPSGVGKSTLANALAPELGVKMGEISEKAGRGKHTTRHVELFELEPDTYIVDAPGFSSLELDVPSTELRNYFPEFQPLAAACPYRGCQHVDEDECAVRTAADTGALAESRYESYCSLWHELRDREEHRY